MTQMMQIEEAAMDETTKDTGTDPTSRKFKQEQLNKVKSKNNETVNYEINNQTNNNHQHEGAVNEKGPQRRRK